MPYYIRTCSVYEKSNDIETSGIGQETDFVKENIAEVTWKNTA